MRNFKNERLGFAVTYYESNRPRQYFPDFIVAAKDADGREAMWLAVTMGEIRPSTVFLPLLPLCSVKAAAEYFDSGEAVELEGWVEADGVMVPFRPNGGSPKGAIVWREVKIGVIARLDRVINRAGHHVTRLRQRRLVAVLG